MWGSKDTVTPAGMPLSEHAIHTLGSNVCRDLLDKDYSAKKTAGRKIEDVIKFFQGKDIGVARERTSTLITLLIDEFLRKDDGDAKIGGAVALVGTARGLEDNIKYYLPDIVKPMISECVEVTDPVVKYYIAECLYNLTLTAPADMIVYLNELYDIQYKLLEDVNPNLRKAAMGLRMILIDKTDKHASYGQIETTAAKIYDQILEKRRLSVARRSTAGSDQPEVTKELQGFFPWISFILERLESRKNFDMGGLSQFRTTKVAACLIDCNIAAPPHRPPDSEKSSSTSKLNSITAEQLIMRCAVVAAKEKESDKYNLEQEFGEVLSTCTGDSPPNTVNRSERSDAIAYRRLLCAKFLTCFCCQSSQRIDNIPGMREPFKQDEKALVPDSWLVLTNGPFLMEVIARFFPILSISSVDRLLANELTYLNRLVAYCVRFYHVQFKSEPGTGRFLQMFWNSLTQLLSNSMSKYTDLITSAVSLESRLGNADCPPDETDFIEILMEWITWLTTQDDDELRDCHRFSEECYGILVDLMIRSLNKPGGTAVTSAKQNVIRSLICNSSLITERKRIFRAVLNHMMQFDNAPLVEALVKFLQDSADEMEDDSKRKAFNQALGESLQDLRKEAHSSIGTRITSEAIEIVLNVLCIRPPPARNHGSDVDEPDPQPQLSWFSTLTTLEITSRSLYQCLLREQNCWPWVIMQVELLVFYLEIPERIGQRLQFRQCAAYDLFSGAVLPVSSPAHQIAEKRRSRHGEPPTDICCDVIDSTKLASPPRWDEKELSEALRIVGSTLRRLLLPFLLKKLERSTLFSQTVSWIALEHPMGVSRETTTALTSPAAQPQDPLKGAVRWQEVVSTEADQVICQTNAKLSDAPPTPNTLTPGEDSAPDVVHNDTDVGATSYKAVEVERPPSPTLNRSVEATENDGQKASGDGRKASGDGRKASGDGRKASAVTPLTMPSTPAVGFSP